MKLYHLPYLKVSHQLLSNAFETVRNEYYVNLENLRFMVVQDEVEAYAVFNDGLQIMITIAEMHEIAKILGQAKAPEVEATNLKDGDKVRVIHTGQVGHICKVTDKPKLYTVANFSNPRNVIPIGTFSSDQLQVILSLSEE